MCVDKKRPQQKLALSSQGPGKEQPRKRIALEKNYSSQPSKKISGSLAMPAESEVGILDFYPVYNEFSQVPPTWSADRS